MTHILQEFFLRLNWISERSVAEIGLQVLARRAKSLDKCTQIIQELASF